MNTPSEHDRIICRNVSPNGFRGDRFEWQNHWLPLIAEPALTNLPPMIYDRLNLILSAALLYFFFQRTPLSPKQRGLHEVHAKMAGDAKSVHF